MRHGTGQWDLDGLSRPSSPKVRRSTQLKPVVPVISLVALLLALAACAAVRARENWGPFRGQLVDVETGQPIAGAAILVVWWEAILSPTGHPTEEFYEARESVTDAEGRFEVPRLSVPFWKLGIQAGQVSYFAPGYAPHAELVTPPDGQPFVDPTVVQMRRLTTREERVEYQGRFPPSIPFEKMPNLLRALNEERRRLGFGPFGVEKQK